MIMLLLWFIGITVVLSFLAEAVTDRPAPKRKDYQIPYTPQTFTKEEIEEGDRFNSFR